MPLLPRKPPLPFSTAAANDPNAPRMKDVAAVLAVHPTTVSLALRGHPSIPLATRERVRQACEKLGYRPNPLVSALMAQRRRSKVGFGHTTLAFVTSSVPTSDWHKSQTLRDQLAGATRRAGELGFKLEEFALYAERTTPRRYNQMLGSRGIVGLLVAPLRNTEETLPIQWDQFSAVALAFTLRRPAIPRVGSDHNQSVRLAISECRQRGYRRIGLAVQLAIMKRVEEQWLAGYLVEHGFPQNASHVPPLLISDLGEKAFIEWIDRTCPEVVLCGGDYPTLLMWLRKSGRKVPHDIALVSLDLHVFDGSVAGIDQRSESIGAQAIDLLVSRMHQNARGAPPQTIRVHVSGEWVPGATLA